MSAENAWVESFPGLLVTLTMAGQVELFSDEVLDYFGKTAEELRHWSMMDAVHPDDLSRVVAAFSSSVATGQPYTIDHRCRRRDGVYRWFHVRALASHDDQGQIAGWFVVLTDIDDMKRAEEALRADIEQRRRAEDALRRSETFLLEVQRISHTGGWRYDVATDSVEASPEIQRFNDPQPGEDISSPAFWFGRIHPEDRPRVQGLFEKCLSEHRDYQAAYRVVLPNGSVRYQYASGHPIVDDDGNLVEFIGACMDMTEHWEATTELHRASEALRDLQAAMSHASHVATMGELAASIAHEVNQPLSGIITNASTCLRMLNGDPPNIEGARETVKRTIRDGNRASDVITKLRALFSKKEFTLESLDISEATQEVIALSYADLQKNGVEIDSELVDDLPPVTGDRVQLQQVILNLIRNASDAMANVYDRPRWLLVRTEREGTSGVRVSVQDGGVGIDAESADKVFDAFYTTKSGGMGIGLSVSRSIIERHGGRIWAAPNNGVGTTFAFSIPTNTNVSIGIKPFLPQAPNAAEQTGRLR